MPVHPKRSSNHLLPANAEVGLSIDEVSDSDQFLHAAIRLKRYWVPQQPGLRRSESWKLTGRVLWFRDDKRRQSNIGA